MEAENIRAKSTTRLIIKETVMARRILIDHSTLFFSELLSQLLPVSFSSFGILPSSSFSHTKCLRGGRNTLLAHFVQDEELEERPPTDRAEDENVAVLIVDVVRLRQEQNQTVFRNSTWIKNLHRRSD